MRKFILMALAAAGIALAAPEFASATPIAFGGGLGTAVDNVSHVAQARHRGWHRWHRHRHCVHRRHWSGVRCF